MNLMLPSMASHPDGAALTTIDASTPASNAAAAAPIRRAHRLRGIRLFAKRVRAAYLRGSGCARWRTRDQAPGSPRKDLHSPPVSRDRGHGGAGAYLLALTELPPYGSSPLQASPTPP